MAGGPGKSVSDAEAHSGRFFMACFLYRRNWQLWEAWWGAGVTVGCERSPARRKVLQRWRGGIIEVEKEEQGGKFVPEEKVIAAKKYRLPSRLNFGRITNCQNEGGGNEKLPHHCGLHKRRSIRRRLSDRDLRQVGPKL